MKVPVVEVGRGEQQFRRLVAHTGDQLEVEAAELAVDPLERLVEPLVHDQLFSRVGVLEGLQHVAGVLVNFRELGVAIAS